MDRARPTGFQIAFFIFALSIVCIPLSKQLRAAIGPGWEEMQVFRLLLFSTAALLIFCFRGARKTAAQLLYRRIPDQCRREVAFVALTNGFMPLAMAGALALWTLHQLGVAGPQHLIAIQRPAADQLDWAFSRSGFFFLVVGVFAAPVIEELVFRGFLFKAWEERWGWIWSAILSSSMFAVYHPHFVSSFVEALLFTAVFRRTGSLRASIIVHAVQNLALWYPLLGRFMFPTQVSETFLGTWWLQLAVLSAAVLAVPYYLVRANRPWKSAQENRSIPS